MRSSGLDLGEEASAQRRTKAAARALEVAATMAARVRVFWVRERGEGGGALYRVER